MTANVNIAVTAIDKASSVINGIGKSLGGLATSVAKVAAGAAVVGITGLTTAIGLSIKATMDWGQQLDNIGDVLGTTAEESAGLASMFKTIGGDSNQLTAAMALMTKGLVNVDGKLGPTGEALKGLGIDFKDAQGKIKPAPELFQDVADKLGNMPDGLEKTSLMMDIFGKSGKEMGDALNAAANGGMKKYIDQAKKMGLVMDPEKVINTKKAFETLKLTFTGIAVQIGSKIIPALQSFAEWIIRVMQSEKVKDFTDKISTLADTVSTFISDLLSGKKDVKDIFSELFNVETIGKAIGKFISGAAEHKAGMLETGMKLIMWIADGIKQNLPIMIPAAIETVKRIAGYISENLPKLVETALSILTTLSGFVIDQLAILIPMAADIVTKIATSIVDNLSKFLQVGLDIIVALVNAIIQNLPQLVTDAAILVVKIVEAIINNLPKIIEAGGQIVTALINKIFSTDWNAVGRQIATKIAEGLSGAQAAGALNPSTYGLTPPSFLKNGLPAPRAGGGSVLGRTPYVVGEVGPELFVPDSNGVIIPNNKLSSTGTTVINVIGWAGDAASLAREIDRQAALERLLA